VRLTIPALAGSFLVLSIAAGTAQAQNDTRAVSTARIASDLEFTDNFDLRQDSLGNALVSTTVFSYGIVRQTDVDSLDLSLQGSVRAVDLPVTGSETSADNPLLVLGYRRDVDDSNISFDVRAQRADIAFFDPLSDIDEDGGFDDTFGDGTRTSLRASLGFGFNEDGPVSLTGFGSLSDISFTDTVDPDLQDRRNGQVGGQVGFRVSPTLRLTTGGLIGLEQSEEDDDLDRTTRRATVGFDGRIDRRTSVTASLGYSRVDTDRSTGDDSTEGVVGELGFAFADRRGETRLDLLSNLDENGQRYSVTVGRSIAWDNGSLDGNLGVSTSEDTDLRVIGNISYSLAGRRNQIGIGLSQSAGTDEDGQNVLNTFGSVSYSHRLTQLSSVNLSLNGGLTRFEDSDATNSERINFTAQFSHDLTEDWSLNGGYRHRQRLTDNDGNAASNAVFFGVQRSFIASR